MGSDNGPKRGDAKRKPVLAYAALLLSAALAVLAIYPPAFLTNECPRLVKSSLTWARGRLASAVGGGERIYTVAELATYDGTDPEKPILLAFNGDVFDVTKGKGFYGVGSGYHAFAGKDGTRALSLGSLSPEDLAKRDVSDFNEQQKKAQKEQHEFYQGKYGPRVGRLAD